MPMFVIPYWDRKCWSFRAMVKGVEAGHITMQHHNDHVFILEVYVEDDFRRLGIAQALVEAVVDCYQANEIRLSINPFRQPGEGNTAIASVTEIMRMCRRYDFVSKPGEPEVMRRKPKGLRT